jgi:hypothetical protein
MSSGVGTRSPPAFLLLRGLTVIEKESPVSCAGPLHHQSVVQSIEVPDILPDAPEAHPARGVVKECEACTTRQSACRRTVAGRRD